jgi:hypothetical protein
LMEPTSDWQPNSIVRILCPYYKNKTKTLTRKNGFLLTHRTVGL